MDEIDRLRRALQDVVDLGAAGYVDPPAFDMWEVARKALEIRASQTGDLKRQLEIAERNAKAMAHAADTMKAEWTYWMARAKALEKVVEVARFATARNVDTPCIVVRAALLTLDAKLKEIEPTWIKRLEELNGDPDEALAAMRAAVAQDGYAVDLSRPQGCVHPEGQRPDKPCPLCGWRDEDREAGG